MDKTIGRCYKCKEFKVIEWSGFVRVADQNHSTYKICLDCLHKIMVNFIENEIIRTT